jgi:hypothetical protein
MMPTLLTTEDAANGVEALLPWAKAFAAGHRCVFALVAWHGPGGKDLRIALGQRSAGNLKHVFCRIGIVGDAADPSLLVNLPFDPRVFKAFDASPTIDGAARAAVSLRLDQLAELAQVAVLAYRTALLR